jgi:hypothetical protein
MDDQRVLPPISPTGFAPRPVWKRGRGGPLASCARGRRHTGNNRIYTLRKVLLHADTFGANPATPEERRACAKMSGRCGRLVQTASRRG